MILKIPVTHCFIVRVLFIVYLLHISSIKLHFSHNMVVNRTSRTEHSAAKKNQLIGAMLAGKKISQAARMFNLPWATASDIWKKYKKTGNTENRHRSGRPRKTNSKDREQIVQQATENCRQTFSDIGNQSSPQLNESTVRRVLAEANYHRRVARKVPFLTKAHKQQRLLWARRYRKFTRKDWSQVIWSDEAYIQLGDKKGRVYVTRRPDEEYLEECLEPAFTQSPVRVMIWGCIMKGRKGPLVVLEYPGGRGGGFNGPRYKAQVLEKVLKGFYAEMSKERGNILFMQDGAPSHRAGHIQQWLLDHGISRLFHPASSPDLNPIEPVWHEIKKIIRAMPEQLGNVKALQAAIHQAWTDLPIKDVNKHIKGMRRRCSAVLKIKGGHTKY